MSQKKIDLMHKLFGELPDRKCKDCQHLVSYMANRKWYKCECYGKSGSEATDWRLKYTACGLIDDADFLSNHVPVVKTLRSYQAKEDVRIEGQVSLFES